MQWTHAGRKKFGSLGIENHIATRAADEDTLEKHGWQDTVSLHGGYVLFDGHRCHEVDVAEGAGADLHILLWQNCEGALFPGHTVDL